MTQCRMRRKIAWADCTKERNGAAGGPTRTAAMPTAREITMICRTLNDRPVLTLPFSIVLEALSPSTFAGTRPLRKSSHEPVDDGCAPELAAIPAWTPG